MAKMADGTFCYKPFVKRWEPLTENVGATFHFSKNRPKKFQPTLPRHFNNPILPNFKVTELLKHKSSLKLRCNSSVTIFPKILKFKFKNKNKMAEIAASKV